MNVGVEMVMEKCFECNELLSESNVRDGFIVCLECGTTCKDNFISQYSEWRQYSDNSGSGGNSGNKVRCTYTGTTKIGTSITSSNFQSQQNLHQWVNQTSSQKHLSSIFKEIENLPLTTEILHYSFNLYEQVYTNINSFTNTKRCNLKKGLIAACVYYSFLKLKIPIEKNEIAQICNLSNKIMSKGCNYFLDVVGLEYINLDPFNVTDFIPKYATLFDMSDKIQNILYEMIDCLLKNDEIFLDLSPSIIICICLYYIFINSTDGITENYDINNISQKTSISLNILKKNFQHLEKHYITLLPFIK